MFWVMLLIYVATTVISALLAAKNKVRPDPLGAFQFPTAQEGRAIPVIFGTVKITGGNTVWWGDLKTHPVTAGGVFGLFGQTVGYKYYIGVQYVLCQGRIDALIGIESDTKPCPFTRSGGDPTILDMNLPKLFGGDKSGGGLAGEINFYFGTSTQGSDPYLSAKQTAIPAFPTYSGFGNGFLSFIAPGTASVNETITIRATNFNIPRGQMQWTVDGSVSGHIGTAYSMTNFGSTKINFMITTGSIQFQIGDQFQIVTTPARVSPSYPGLCYAVLKQFYIGTSSYPKPINFIVRRCPNPFGMTTSVAVLNPDSNGGGDANPVFAIYDLLTNAAYGLGIAPANIDVTNFQQAATTLANENLDVSFQVDQIGSADNIIAEVLRHIDGFLYVEPTTGLWTIKLARADYDPTTIPVLTVDNVLEIPKFSRAQWWETINQIFIQYTDRNADFTVRTVQNHDLANVVQTGEVRAETMEFKQLSNSTTAALMATRCLRAVTYPLSKLTVIVNRTAWKWRVGGVFKFTWVPLGIVSVVYRITRIGYGELVEGKIHVECVEDVFGISTAAFQPPPDSGWVNPTGAPMAPVFQRLMEVPYALALAGETVGIWVYALCARQDGTPTSFQVWQNFGAGDVQTNDLPQFCPVGVLTAPYPASAGATDLTGFTIGAGGADLDLLQATDEHGFNLGTNLAVIDDEIISWKTPTVNLDGSITIAKVMRGVLDTVPADHASGALVLFFSIAEGVTQTHAYPADLNVRAKFLPENNLGVFPLSSAAENDLTTGTRYLAPYPPGNLHIGALAWGVVPPTVTGDLTFTWSSRNRLTQTSAGTMVPQDAGDITPETGTTYNVVIKIAGATIRTVTGISAETYTYTAAQRGIDDPDFTKPVTIELLSNANSHDSYFAQTFTTVMTGPSGTLGPGRYEFGSTTVGGILV